MAIDRERDDTAESGRSASMVTDHPHTPPDGQWWARCTICRLGEAAHLLPAVEP